MFAFLLCLFLLFPFFAYASVDSISAQSAVAIDSCTNKLIYEKNSYEKLSIASTTKIMTCLIACESNKLDSVVTITEEMLAGTEGSLIYLKTGDKITLLDLVKGALLASGNDAANAIAVYLGKSIEGFAMQMNAKAESIGLLNTHYVTPSGLDADDHYSTAYDLALLASYAISNDVFRQVCSLQRADIVVSSKTKTVNNHNKLLSFDNAFCGIKTGFTSKAGRCLVSAYSINNSYVIIVTLNAPNDWDDHMKIKDFCVKKYKTNICRDDYNIDVVGGKKAYIKCSQSCTISYLDKLVKKVYYYPFIYAPVYKGEQVGRVDFYSNNKLIESVEITASESVELWRITK